jgi:hypothetical protein
MFNETITLVESDEGLDGETFFLYVFLAAFVVLLLVGAQQLLASFGVSRISLGVFRILLFCVCRRRESASLKPQWRWERRITLTLITTGYLRWPSMVSVSIRPILLFFSALGCNVVLIFMDYF